MKESFVLLPTPPAMKALTRTILNYPHIILFVSLIVLVVMFRCI